MPWQDRAACAGDRDPDAWFASGCEAEARAHARAVCVRCPVRRDCLTDAMERDDQWSIRGGVLPEERALPNDSRLAVLRALDLLGGRATTAELAASTGLPPGTVRRRVEYLHTSGTIVRQAPSLYAFDVEPVRSAGTVGGVA